MFLSSFFSSLSFSFQIKGQGFQTAMRISRNDNATPTIPFSEHSTLAPYSVVDTAAPYLKAAFCHTQNARYRPTMEDASKLVSNFLDSPGSAYYAVFDGHAGSFAANWCAANVYKLLAQNLLLFSGHWSVPAIFASTFEQADRRLATVQGTDRSGCTAAIVYVKTEIVQQSRRRYSFSPAEAARHAATCGSVKKNRTLYTANVGDSRIVLSSRGMARRLTHDHRASDSGETLRIRQLNGKVTMGRVNGQLAVSRAIGDLALKPWVSARPHTSSLLLDDDDEFVIIACDGVWDVVKDQVAVDLIRHIENVTEAAQELVRHALFKGSTDNVTCMVVRFRACTEMMEPPLQGYVPKKMAVMDTIRLPETAMPLERNSSDLVSTPRARNKLRFHVVQPPGSPAESDATISEDEEDAIEELPYADENARPKQRPDLTLLKAAGRPRRSGGAAAAAQSRDVFHVRSSSFSPSVLLEHAGREKTENTEESSLDRYGRFKRVVQMEFDYDGDDCAIADSD